MVSLITIIFLSFHLILCIESYFYEVCRYGVHKDRKMSWGFSFVSFRTLIECFPLQCNKKLRIFLSCTISMVLLQCYSKAWKSSVQNWRLKTQLCYVSFQARCWLFRFQWTQCRFIRNMIKRNPQEQTLVSRISDRRWFPNRHLYKAWFWSNFEVQHVSPSVYFLQPSPR